MAQLRIEALLTLSEETASKLEELTDRADDPTISNREWQRTAFALIEPNLKRLKIEDVTDWDWA